MHTSLPGQPKRQQYFFEEVLHCEMCGDPSEGHIILGQRLNQSQGLSPKKRTGISVTVMKCRKCGLIYPQPMPIPFDVQHHYGTPPEDYWRPDYFLFQPGYFSEQISITKELLPFKTGMTALDIGAGLGKGMLALSDAGFDAYGFEPSEPFYERAISKMGIPKEKLQLGMIEDMDYQPNSFNFISFGAVLEHLYHPARSIEKALHWLKPGGVIHIEVPHSNHFPSRLINRYYRLRGTNYVTHLSPMHPPFHLFEFDLRSFTALGKKLHYSIARQQIDPCEVLSIPKIFHPQLKKYMKRTNTCLQITVYLRKELK